MAAQPRNFENLVEAFNALDDVKQFFIGNVKSLIETHGSTVDKQLFRDARSGFNRALQTLSFNLTGKVDTDATTTAQLFEDVVLVIDQITDMFAITIEHRKYLFRSVLREDIRRLVVDYVLRQARANTFGDGLQTDLTMLVSLYSVAAANLCDGATPVNLMSLAKKHQQHYIQSESSVQIIASIRRSLVDEAPYATAEMKTLVFARFVHDLLNIAVDRTAEEVTP